MTYRCCFNNVAENINSLHDRNIYEANVSTGLRCRCDKNIEMNLKEIGCGMNSNGSGQGPVVSSCEHGNESLGSIKTINDYWLLKKDSAPCR
jgi:hypothetical protein